MPATNYRLLGAASIGSTAANGQEAAAISADVSGGGVYLDGLTFAQATAVTNRTSAVLNGSDPRPRRSAQ